MFPTSDTATGRQAFGGVQQPASLVRALFSGFFACKNLGVVGDGVATVDLHRDDQRLCVISLSCDEPLGCAFERGGRGDIGAGDELLLLVLDGSFQVSLLLRGLEHRPTEAAAVDLLQVEVLSEVVIEGGLRQSKKMR